MAFDFPTTPLVGETYNSGNITYTWDGQAWMRDASSSTATGDYVRKAGDTMLGFLTLNADPTAPLHAATKQYIDSLFAALGGNPGEALVKNQANTPAWGSPIESGNY